MNTALAIYGWGAGAGAVVGAICALAGWRGGLPLVSDHRDHLPPKNMLDLVGVVLCCTLVWPYLAILAGCALWSRWRRRVA